MKSKTRADARQPRIHAGFTLLEVLAAVLIFAVVFTTLAGHAMEWVRSEGVSERRLRASLIADEVLLEIEAGIALGSLPDSEGDEQERDEFTVTTDVTPWDLPFEFPDEEAGNGSDISLLDAGDTNPEGILRRARVRVSWLDGMDEHEVSRTTFAIDVEAANQILSNAGLGSDEGEVASDGDDLVERDPDEEEEE